MRNGNELESVFTIPDPGWVDQRGPGKDRIGRNTVALFIDLSKAFNTVNHTSPIQRFSEIGLDQASCRLLKITLVVLLAIDWIILDVD